MCHWIATIQTPPNPWGTAGGLFWKTTKTKILDSVSWGKESSWKLEMCEEQKRKRKKKKKWKGPDASAFMNWREETHYPLLERKLTTAQTPRLCQHTHIKWAVLYICVCALCCIATILEQGFEVMSGLLNIKQYLTRERNYSAKSKGCRQHRNENVEFRSPLCWRKVWRKFCSPEKQSCSILPHSWGRWEQNKNNWEKHKFPI